MAGKSNAAPQEPHDPFAGEKAIQSVEFLKPGQGDIGTAVVGVVTKISAPRTGSDGKEWSGSVTLSPVIVVKPNGDGKGFEAFRIALNATLKDKVTRAMIGRKIGLRFRELVKSPKGGNPMRVWDVYVLTDAKFETFEARYAPGLLAAHAAQNPAVSDSAPDNEFAPPDDTGLPF